MRILWSGTHVALPKFVVVLIQTDLGVKSLDELFTPIAVVVTQLQRKKLFKQI